jgi:hypothetical protein
MTKQNSKTAKPQLAKLRRAPRGATNPGTQQTDIHDSHYQSLEAITNPFCEGAKRAKLPGVGAGSTMSEQVVRTGTIVSNGAGNAAIEFSDKPNCPTLVADGPSNVLTYSTAWSDAVDSLCYLYGDQYRVVSYGVRLMSLLSATDSKGVIKLRRGSPIDAGAISDVSPDAYTHTDIHAIGPNSEFHMIARPMNVETMNFETVSNYSTTSSNPVGNWECLFVHLEGVPPDTSCFYYELFTNFEYIFKPASLLSKLQSPQPVSNPAMLSARDHVQSSMTNHKGGAAVVKAAIKREGKKALTKHVLPFLLKKGSELLV